MTVNTAYHNSHAPSHTPENSGTYEIGFNLNEGVKILAGVAHNFRTFTSTDSAPSLVRGRVLGIIRGISGERSEVKNANYMILKLLRYICRRVLKKLL